MIPYFADFCVKSDVFKSRKLSAISYQLVYFPCFGLVSTPLALHLISPGDRYLFFS